MVDKSKTNDDAKAEHNAKSEQEERLKNARYLVNELVNGNWVDNPPQEHAKRYLDKLDALTRSVTKNGGTIKDLAGEINKALEKEGLKSKVNVSDNRITIDSKFVQVVLEPPGFSKTPGISVELVNDNNKKGKEQVQENPLLWSIRYNQKSR